MDDCMHNNDADLAKGVGLNLNESHSAGKEKLY